MYVRYFKSNIRLHKLAFVCETDDLNWPEYFNKSASWDTLLVKVLLNFGTSMQCIQLKCSLYISHTWYTHIMFQIDVYVFSKVPAFFKEALCKRATKCQGFWKLFENVWIVSTILPKLHTWIWNNVKKPAWIHRLCLLQLQGVCFNKRLLTGKPFYS